jgi:outer membrane biosynthesis protein TonB
MNLCAEYAVFLDCKPKKPTEEEKTYDVTIVDKKKKKSEPKHAQEEDAKKMEYILENSAVLTKFTNITPKTWYLSNCQFKKKTIQLVFKNLALKKQPESSSTSSSTSSQSTIDSSTFEYWIPWYDFFRVLLILLVVQDSSFFVFIRSLHKY